MAGGVGVDLGGDVVADHVLVVVAVLEVGDSVVEVAALTLAGAVGAGDEAVRGVELEADLEDEALVGAAGVGHAAAVDDEQGEGAGARDEPGAVGAAELADEPQAVGVAHGDAGGELGGVEGDGLFDRAAGMAGPDPPLALAAFLRGVRIELALGVLGPSQAGDDVAALAGREQDGHAERGREHLALLRGGLLEAGVVGLAIVAGTVLVVVGGVVDLAAVLGGEEAGEVPARRREVEDLRGVVRVAAGEGTDDVGAEGLDEVSADGGAGVGGMWHGKFRRCWAAFVAIAAGGSAGIQRAPGQQSRP